MLTEKTLDLVSYGALHDGGNQPNHKLPCFKMHNMSLFCLKGTYGSSFEKKDKNIEIKCKKKYSHTFSLQLNCV